MRFKLNLLLLGTLFCLSVSARQETTPFLKGEVEIDMNRGLISCRFLLSAIPELGKSYQLLLNKGFNIKSISDSTGKMLKYEGYYNGKMRGEGLSYLPYSDHQPMENPGTLFIEYTGAFPVYDGSYNFTDFKGLIAFNGQTVRATDQAKWYPVIYDVAKDRQLEEVRYEIHLKVPGAKTLFINGDLPKKGPEATFSAHKATAPLLFAGNYEVQETPNALFLNTHMKEEQLALFEQYIAEMKSYYSRQLKIPDVQKNVFIEHQPIEKFNKGRSWGFVTYPVIAFAGTPLSEMIDLNKKQLTDSTDYTFIAHEIAHYYFGNVLRPNGPLSWFFLESTAEYLSFKASEAKFGPSFVKNYLTKQTGNLQKFKGIPLSEVIQAQQINSTYRYQYGPLLWRGLEQIAGEKAVFQTFRNMLAAHNEYTDYSFFKKHALTAGITPAQWQQFEDQFIKSENACKLIVISS